LTECRLAVSDSGHGLVAGFSERTDQALIRSIKDKSFIKQADFAINFWRMCLLFCLFFFNHIRNLQIPACSVVCTNFLHYTETVKEAAFMPGKCLSSCSGFRNVCCGLSLIHFAFGCPNATSCQEDLPTI